ncbi:hypothetical protein [Armatimonas sp.]|uniref:hypothetical protein n=1 Tax=Armatimonas sp. TaxID=1872638 RepID=UPI00286A5A7A|nr:hypothetical protein [Armatimonas sp.]
MPNYLNALKRGFAAAVTSSSTAHSFSAADKKIVCLHCGEDKFFRGNALIDRNRLIDTDWFDSDVALLACAKCSRLEWFADEPKQLS